MQMKVVGQMEDMRGQASDRGSLNYINLTTGCLYELISRQHTLLKQMMQKYVNKNICFEIEDCDRPEVDHKMVIRGQEGPHGSVQLLKTSQF